MPLFRDDEYAEELIKAQQLSLSGWDTSRVVSLITIASVFGVIIWFEADRDRLIAEIIAVGFLVLVYKFDKGVKDLYFATMQCAFVAEWVGRKQLGEYEKPPN